MSDFKVDDTMAKIRYELDDREIYNDIRSEIGVLVSETIVDADPTYSGQAWTRFFQVHIGETVRAYFTARYADPSNWEIKSHEAYYVTLFPGEPYARVPYYDYSITLVSVDDATKYVKIVNTGNHSSYFRIVVGYRYRATERITHEETTPITLTVRATDATSIRKYGRRVMNLTWSEGTEEGAMQSLVTNYLTRYKNPIPRLKITVKGTTDTLRTQIITREISDRLTVVCDNLGLNTDFFINSISIIDGPVGIPICTWGVEEQRPEEALTIFLIDTSEVDGPHIIGS